MFKKLKTLSIFYVGAIIFAVILPFMKTITMNNGELNTFELSLFGFFLGMAFEGFLLIVTATFVVLFTDKLQ